MKVYVLICPTSGKYLKDSVARHLPNVELTSELNESYNSENHAVVVALKRSNDALKDYRLALRELVDESNEAKKQLLKNTAFKGRGSLSTHKRYLIKRGR